MNTREQSFGKTQALIYSNTENSPCCAPLLRYCNINKIGARNAVSFVLLRNTAVQKKGRKHRGRPRQHLLPTSRQAPRAGAAGTTSGLRFPAGTGLNPFGNSHVSQQLLSGKGKKKQKRGWAMRMSARGPPIQFLW